MPAGLVAPTQRFPPSGLSFQLPLPRRKRGSRGTGRLLIRIVESLSRSRVFIAGTLLLSCRISRASVLALVLFHAPQDFKTGFLFVSLFFFTDSSPLSWLPHVCDCSLE